LRYVPNSPADRDGMLRAIGVESIDQLFAGIPENLRLDGALRLPPAMSEPELLAYFKTAADRNRSDELSFLGAGAYPHYIPTIVDSLISRSEFYTAYTPYQAEIAQGTLQAIFEFQTFIAQLTGLDVANASLYDGSTALAEAVLMAHRITGRTRFLIARTVHPEYRAVVDTYTRRLGFTFSDLGFTENGQVDLAALEAAAGEDCAAVILQSPNFFGTLDRTREAAEIAHRSGALSVVGITEALSLGLVVPPGSEPDPSRRADIVVGEAQSLGIPMSFGGPHLGFLATRQSYLRQMPGRLVGQGHDTGGRRAFVLTLSTREQHIRREKATSNICTNESLCALMATIYLATLGPRGLREVAIRNVQATVYLLERIAGTTDARVLFPGPRFNEAVIRPSPAALERLREMRSRGIARGLELGPLFPELEGALLISATEVYSKPVLDAFVKELR